jgi:uncharacterized protein YceK
MRLFVILLLTSVFFTGCATIISGTKQNVVFNSEPSGSTVYLRKRQNQEVAIGTTPLSTEIKRSTKSVVLKKEGYQDYLYQIDYTINAWYWGNFLFGGAPGMIIDLSTGSWKKLENEVKVPLIKKSN